MTRQQIVLNAKPPFRLDLTVWALRRREKNAVDRWDGEHYGRVVVVDGKPVGLTVTQESKSPTVKVIAESASKLDRHKMGQLGQLVRKMLGLDVDLGPFYVVAGGQPLIRPLVERFSGVKPPRFPSLFEGLVNAVACQQVTLDLGIVLLNRLSEGFGRTVVDRGASRFAFPTPTDLATVPEESIKKLGFSLQKARAIKALALGVTDGELDLETLEDVQNEEALRRMTDIRGIGRWSAEYVLLRGLGRLKIFPGDDIGAQNNLRRLFNLDEKPNYEEIRRLTSAWHPYEGLIYFHLLLKKLHESGVI